ncbi:MAG: hypothetical protein ETSY1_20430 [Candidatus Entotheonella factor]|uniref:Uncharacterized protein n=1 Tax=Entotheonella factor TaxID=1429438 RepID=W4LJC3_ENTF1|nr:MAG: hypothetical protein ETSY1_20430 [Candidatus Entotheonella factor]
MSVYKLFVLYMVIGLCCTTGFALSPNETPQNVTSTLGTNVAPFNSNTPGWVLVDAFPKTGSWFFSTCPPPPTPVSPPQSTTLDANGWISALTPGECAGTLVFNNLLDDQGVAHYPAGTYVLLFEGEGRFTFGDGTNEVLYENGMVGPNMTPVETQNGLKRITLDLPQSGQGQDGISFFLTSVAPAPNHLRNFRLLVPGGVCGVSPTQLNRFKSCSTSRGGQGQCDANETCYDFEQVYFDRFRDAPALMGNKVVFHPAYIQHYRPYRAIRYMKWSRVEDSQLVNWSDRVSMHEVNFTSDTRGFPYEYMIAMSNQLRADAYFNIPVLANDGFIEAYGRLVNDHLDPALRAYVEYGNEFFNSAQAVPWPEALAAANASGSGIPSSDSDLIKVAKWSSRQGAAVMNRWRNQFTNPNRVTRVLAGFNPVSDYTQAALDATAVNGVREIDALAMMGYLGPDRRFVDDPARFDTLSIDELFEEIEDGRHLNSEASLQDLGDVYDEAQTMAGNLELILYEFGQHIVPTNSAPQPTIDRVRAANRDSRMRIAYEQNIARFRTAGGTMAFHFLVEDVWDHNGFFGLLEFQDEDPVQSPKYQAILNAIP